MKLRFFGISAALVCLAGCAVPAPRLAAPVAATPDPLARQAQALVARMSVEHTVAQLIMPDISTITPADLRQYRFGTILNGGNSGPGGNDLAPAADWLALADAMWEASTGPLPNDEPGDCNGQTLFLAMAAPAARTGATRAAICQS